MNYEITTSINKSVLEILLSGRGGAENALQIASEVIDIIDESETKLVMIDICSMKKNLNLLEFYKFIKFLPVNAPRIKTAIIHNNTDPDKNTYDTIAENHGYIIKHFENIEEAYKWFNHSNS